VDKPLFYKICQHSVIPLVVVDDEGVINFVNEAAEKLFGNSAEELCAGEVYSLFPDDQKERVRSVLDRVFAKGETESLDCALAVSGEFSDRQTMLITSLDVEEGEASKTVIQFCDLSQEVEQIRERAGQQKMAALCAMAGGLAHHFNNLMGGILTSADFAKESNDPRVLKRALHSTIEALNRANELVRNLLTFAEGDRTVCPAGAAVEIVKVFADTQQRRLAEQNIEVETHLEPIRTELPTRQLMTILNLLADNAAEAMPGGGTLRIELSQQGKEIVLKISDTGRGIPADHIPGVFEPFFTTKGVDSEEAGEHPGLGLSAVHGIVKDMEGRVQFVSQPGRGTSCTVFIPSHDKI
jgi:signal transduction histidine kinase